MPEPLIMILTIALGALTGTLSGMFGVGGAVISTPGIRVLGAAPIEAVGSTLPSIIPSSIAGTIRYAREGLVRVRLFAITGITGAVAAIGGAVLAEVLPGDGHVLMLCTAALVGLTSFRMRRTPEPRRVIEGAPPGDQTWKLIVIGLAAGALSGLLGIGGGVLMVPLFTLWLGLDVKTAVATSLACVGLIAIPGTITHAVLGNVRWSFALLLAIGAIPGAWFGARITIGARERTVRLLIASLLGAVAAAYGIGEIIALMS